MLNYVKPVLTGVVLVLCILAWVGIRTLPVQAAPPQNVTSQSAPSSATPGRYQLQDINGTSYLLDTETGRVWVNRKVVTATSKYNTITGSGGTLKIPIPDSTWVEDSPAWAKPR